MKALAAPSQASGGLLRPTEANFGACSHRSPCPSVPHVDAAWRAYAVHFSLLRSGANPIWQLSLGVPGPATDHRGAPGTRTESDEHLAPQVDPDHYFRPEYDNKGRFISYWHQINEVLSSRADSVLEVGVGGGLVAHYLRDRDLDLTTLDIEYGLYPDCVGSVLNIPFAPNAFDVVTCCEVLEHIPYELFPVALGELQRVATSTVVISLPDAGRVYRVFVQVPGIRVFRFLIRLPRLRQQAHEFDGEHFWEIGKRGFGLDDVTNLIEKAGFQVVRTHQVFERPYYRFFILRKVGCQEKPARCSRRHSSTDDQILKRAKEADR